MKRRNAIKTGALGICALSLGTTFAKSTFSKMSEKSNIGVQLFTIPMMVDKDFKGTMKLLGEIGYKEVEFYGPYPGSTETAKQGFKMMQDMMGLKRFSFFGLSEKETASLLDDCGLTAPSMHANIDSFRNGLTELMDSFAEIGPKYIVVPAIMGGRDNLDDYKKLADEFNNFGEQMSKYNMTFLYHNHGFEHTIMDGKVPMDFLIENTDPNYVQFELDIFWMSAAGANPIDYLEKYPGRYKAMHIKDASEHFRFAGDGSTPDQWMAGFPKMADPGHGVFDIEKMMKAGRKSGVEHFFLERDLAPKAEETLRVSFEYMSKV